MKIILLPQRYIKVLIIIYALIITAASVLQASPVKAQQEDKTFSLKYKNTNIHQIILDIQNKSNVDISFTSKLGLEKMAVSEIEFNKKTVREILTALLDKHNIIATEKADGFILSIRLSRQRIITGKVTDENDRPLGGANISVKQDKSFSATTNNEGNFKLSVPDNIQILVVSYIGYQPQDVQLSNRNNINIRLLPENQQLQNVMVIGYGTQSKRNVTGSIGQIKAEAIKDQPITSFDQAMAGRIAGVDVSQSNGAPGGGVTMNIRGVSSISGSNAPLFVVDGVPLSSSSSDDATQGKSSNSSFNSSYTVNPLSAINPNDIETIEVLKDAASAAIYGSRGSNGVVLITTKKGKRGEKGTINFNTYVGLQNLAKKVDVMDAYEFADYTKKTRDLSWIAKGGGRTADDAQNLRGAADKYAPYLLPYINREPGLSTTDWQDEIYRSAMTQNNELSVRGGTDKVRYYVSGNYLNQDGIIINSGLKRYGGRANIDIDLSKRIRLGVNFNASYSDNKMVQSEANWNKEGIVITALMYHPNLPVYNTDGSYALSEMIKTNVNGLSSVATIENPVALANLIDNSLKSTQLLGNTYLEADLIDGMKFKTSFGIDLNNLNRSFYRPKTLSFGSNLAGTVGNQPYNYAWSNKSSVNNWIVENTLTYDKTFGDHQLNFLLGYTAQKETTDVTFLEGSNFPNDNIRTLGSAGSTQGYSSINQATLLSYLGRVMYSFQGKYLLSASLRRDGSSRFAKDSKWGWFPAVSAGWRISQEDFFPKESVINDLKLRASYGLTGNTKIPYYGGTATLGSYNYTSGNNLTIGLAPSNIPNNKLSWESTGTVDAGLDVSFFNNKLNFTADYYKSNTNKLLLNVTVPGSSGFTSSLQNVGEVENKGFEFTVSVNQKLANELNWTGSFNLSTNSNKVISLAPGQSQIIYSGGLTDAFIVRVGESLGSYYGYKVLGVFKSQEEFDKTPHLMNANQAVGDFIYADANNDGKVDANDRVVLGNNNPKFTWGFNSSFTYKNFDFSFNLQGKHGYQNFNSMHRYLAETWGNDLAAYLSEDAPRPVWGVGSASHTRPSSWHVEDGSFVRLRNVTLGYTLPASLLGKAKISNLRIYCSALNPFTWTDYSGYNPEVSNNFGSSTRAGEEFGNYPVFKSFIAGLNLSF